MSLDGLFLVCSCGSLEHQMFFWYDKEDKVFYTEVHLTTHKGFFKRLWYGLKYAFGYKCKYGAWDEFIFEKKESQELFKFLAENE